MVDEEDTYRMIIVDIDLFKQYKAIAPGVTQPITTQKTRQRLSLKDDLTVKMRGLICSQSWHTRILGGSTKLDIRNGTMSQSSSYTMATDAQKRHLVGFLA